MLLPEFFAPCCTRHVDDPAPMTAGMNTLSLELQTGVLTTEKGAICVDFLHGSALSIHGPGWKAPPDRQ